METNKGLGANTDSLSEIIHPAHTKGTGCLAPSIWWAEPIDVYRPASHQIARIRERVSSKLLFILPNDQTKMGRHSFTQSGKGRLDTHSRLKQKIRNLRKRTVTGSSLLMYVDPLFLPQKWHPELHVIARIPNKPAEAAVAETTAKTLVSVGGFLSAYPNQYPYQTRLLRHLTSQIGHFLYWQQTLSHLHEQPPKEDFAPKQSLRDSSPKSPIYSSMGSSRSNARTLWCLTRLRDKRHPLFSFNTTIQEPKSLTRSLHWSLITVASSLNSFRPHHLKSCLTAKLSISSEGIFLRFLIQLIAYAKSLTLLKCSATSI